MARRRKDEKEIDLGFEVPPFDEDEFIRKETISFRTTLILFLYSIATALASFLVWVYVDHSWALALFIGGLLGVLLRWIYPALKVDISHFKRKEWIGTGFLYFFSWLAFFIFLTNPPLYDGVPPELNLHITPDAQEPGGVVNITIVTADNVRVDGDTLEFKVTGPDGAAFAGTTDLWKSPHHGVWAWNHMFTAPGTYTVTASVRDVDTGLLATGARTRTTEGSFTVGPAVTVLMSGADKEGVGHFTAPTDGITVRVPNAVDAWRVSLEHTNTSNADRVELGRAADLDSDDARAWFARVDSAGFHNGTNSFKVVVKEHDSYWLGARYDIPDVEAPIISARNYTVEIPNADLVDDDKAKLPRKRATSPAQTPGFEAVGAVVALAVVAIALARRRKA